MWYDWFGVPLLLQQTLKAAHTASVHLSSVLHLYHCPCSQSEKRTAMDARSVNQPGKRMQRWLTSTLISDIHHERSLSTAASPQTDTHCLWWDWVYVKQSYLTSTTQQDRRSRQRLRGGSLCKNPCSTLMRKWHKANTYAFYEEQKRKITWTLVIEHSTWLFPQRTHKTHE